MIINILIAILLISAVIVVHEFGHFIIAKANGVCVVEFSIGFGPRIFSFRIGDTDYCLKALPFGGSCQMLGNMDLNADPSSLEEGQEGDEEELSEFEKRSKEMLEKYGESRTMEAKSVSARIAILAAGPVFNFLFALIMSVFLIGLNGVDIPKVNEVVPNSPAYNSGLRQGDIISKVNGKNINFARELSFYQSYHQSEDLNLEYVRDGKKFTSLVVPEVKDVKDYKVGISFSADLRIASFSKESPAKSAGLKTNDKIISIDGQKIKEVTDLTKIVSASEGKELTFIIQRAGREKTYEISPKLMETKTYYTGLEAYGEKKDVSPASTIGYAFLDTGYRMTSLVEVLGKMFTGGVSLSNLSGPVGAVSSISSVVEDSKEGGSFIVFLNVINMMTMLSVNLGIMNLLPIPALDGGRLLLCIIEAIRGKKAGKKAEGIVNFIGVVFILLLTLFVLIKDIANLF